MSIKMRFRGSTVFFRVAEDIMGIDLSKVTAIYYSPDSVDFFTPAGRLSMFAGRDLEQDTWNKLLGKWWEVTGKK